MIIMCGTDSIFKVLNNLIVIFKEVDVKHVLLIKSRYRVKFLNCIHCGWLKTRFKIKQKNDRFILKHCIIKV